MDGSIFDVVRSPVSASNLSAHRFGCSDEIWSPTVSSPPIALEFSGSNGSNNGSDVPGCDGVCDSVVVVSVRNT